MKYIARARWQRYPPYRKQRGAREKPECLRKHVYEVQRTVSGRPKADVYFRVRVDFENFVISQTQNAIVHEVKFSVHARWEDTGITK